MDTVYFILQQMMGFSIPLLLVALGGMFSVRSGVVNIALEGIMVMGALVSIIFVRLTGDAMADMVQVQLLLAIIVAAVAGIVFSLLHAFASITISANQIISGQALNTFAPAFSIFLARLMFGDMSIQFANDFKIDKIPVLGDIPVIGDIFFKQAFTTTYIGIAILLIAAFVLFKTKFGLRLRACGEFPQAPDSVGVNVYKMRYAGVMISGALAGIGGLVYVISSSVTFGSTVAGYGFLAMAVMILGQWSPFKILVASFFFGLMKTISAAYSAIDFLSDLPISANIYKMLPYIITIIVLLFGSKNSREPKASGKPYEKGMR